MLEFQREVVDQVHGRGTWEALGDLGMRRYPVHEGLTPLVLGYVGEFDPLEVETDLMVVNSCVYPCGGDATRLSASVVVDLALSRSLIPVVRPATIAGVVGSGQEVNYVPGARNKDWPAVVARLRALYESFLGEGVRVVDTSDPVVWELVRSMSQKLHLAGLSDDRLAGMYELLGGGFPAGTPWRYYYPYFRANVVTYTADFLSTALRRTADRVVIVENLQQSKAILTSRDYGGSSRVSHLVTLTAPHFDSGPMCLAQDDDLVPVDALLDPQSSPLAWPDAAASTNWYWRQVSQLLEPAWKDVEAQ